MRMFSGLTRKTIVVDLDSTICDTSPRHHLVPDRDTVDWRVNENWYEYCLAAHMDLPIDGMVTLVKLLHPHHVIWLLTGRMSIARDVTEDWLAKIQLPYDGLRMREDHEAGSVDDYKLMALRELQDQGHEIVLVIDDFLDTCERIAEELHIPTIAPRLPTHYANQTGRVGL